MLDDQEDLFADGFCSVPEAKAITTLSRSMLYGLMEKGELAYTRVGRRRLIPKKALMALRRKNLTKRDNQAGNA